MKVAITIVLLLFAAGALAVSATYLLAGIAWAMLVAAGALILFAALLRQGMTSND